MKTEHYEQCLCYDKSVTGILKAQGYKGGQIQVKLKLWLVQVAAEEVGFEGGFEGRERVQFPNVAR